MRKLIQYVVVVASVGVGMLIGRYAFVPALMALVPHMTWLLPQSGPPKHDFGDMIGAILTAGYSMGLSIGVGMTLAIFGGLFAGLALARRLKMPDPSPILHTV